MVKNVWYSKGPPNNLIGPFENQKKKCPKSQMFRFQVFGIQVVTVITIRRLQLYLKPKSNVIYAVGGDSCYSIVTCK